MTKVKLGVIQCALGGTLDSNLETVERLIRDAAGQGAQIILTPELIEGPYFCKTQEEDRFDLARPLDTHPAVERFQALANELNVVLPVSVFERDGSHTYNTLVMINAGGERMGIYRKSHIPDGPGYQEKYYFRPGNTGFKVWNTAFGRIGVGVCWDQWFPEAARVMALKGAEILLYPTAIGAEPHDPGLETSARWQRAMQGHAVSNCMPVAAANRIGVEDGQAFYGSSFIADQTGAKLAEAGRDDEAVLVQEFDLAFLERDRSAWGFFRDRRTELYKDLLD
ncbi:N-carbamoylputrescine amidase [Ponticaulis sp.]|uniref:N-carbamoylputrescine amidase n=1 Tax=Ponticaulis sp. TaxID=2020902 RepID=UPI000B6E1F60|nr:N-carbamoylputrescine amidase [Ponticaulis sp.]MAI89960.1 N-carbamoylputrescine amidase [Ponticaulis sp.]OUX99627.1 MAG: N-carbamoylputrescine amidase [Hyphomonadaceae bacterium TMED5]|tara:strand:- start:50783 stop:51625 length:843 start_codon:yes stop_codon:yes gene_type:complete